MLAVSGGAVPRRPADRRPGQPPRRCRDDPLLRDRAGSDRPRRPASNLLATRPVLRRAGHRAAAAAPSSPSARTTSINRVVFEGNKKVEKAEPSSGQIAVQGAAAPFSQAIVDADVQRLREVYRRAGRGNATVSSRIVDLPNGRVDVVFAIDEGDKTGIKSINFVGNNAYSSGTPARPDDLDRDELPELPQDVRRLRSRPDHLRPRARPPLLPEERLCRLPRSSATDARFDEAQRAARSSRSRWTRAPQYRVGNVAVDSASARRRYRRARSARSAPPPATSTTPRTSRRR